MVVKIIVYFLLISACLANLVVWTPDDLNGYSIICALSKFGDPFILPHYGRLFFFDLGSGCSIYGNLPQNSYAIVYGISHPCYYSDLALSVQDAGGIGLIIVLEIDNMNYVMYAKNALEASKVTINVIGIGKTNGAKIKKYSSNEI